MTIDGALPPAVDTFRPRKYQEEIFRRAQRSNIIAALDTGSGKTFISTLLIRWLSTQPRSSGKVVIFLVPKVALVEQQAAVIETHTPLRVHKLHGAANFELADRDKWSQMFGKTDVVVVTAQIFLNILNHSLWNIDKVSLLVFDECHHTRKNHAYNGIMRECFQYPASQRPKIFGMTASPIWNPKDAENSLRTLEKNLDATVIAVREHVDELAANSPRPRELIREFPPFPETYTYLSVTLWNCLAPFFEDAGFERDRLDVRYHVARSAVGPYGAELVLFSEVNARIAQIRADRNTALDRSRKLLGLEGIIDVGDGQEENSIFDEDSTIAEALAQIDSILTDFEPFLGCREPLSSTESTTDESSLVTIPLPIAVPLEWCAPKISTLVEILLEFCYADTRHAGVDSPTSTGMGQGIVFVEQRQIASCLARVLPAIPELAGRIRCAELVGHGGQHRGLADKSENERRGGSKRALLDAKGMRLQRQQETVKQFREGKLNLIIATSVAEEGLDFPSCDVVIRYDALQHMVGYLQSRGRARNKTSTFIVMVQQGHTAQLERYRAFLASEPELRKVYEQREQPVGDDSADTGSNPPDEDDDSEERQVDDEDPDDLAARERYLVPETGATLTYTSAIGLLNILCMLIPHDPYTRTPVPSYTTLTTDNGAFRVVLTLPPGIPLPVSRLVYRGPPRRSKREARRAAAFRAVRSLHKLDVFDEYLLPATSARSRSAIDADGVPIPDVSMIPKFLTVRVRDPWCLGQKLHLHIIHVDGRATAGLVTGSVLPSVKLMIEGERVEVWYKAPLISREEEEWSRRHILDAYTRAGIWMCNTGRPIPLPLSQFLVPLDADLMVDFAAMEPLVARPWGRFDWTRVTEKDYDRLMVMNNNQLGRPVILRNIRHDLTPLSIPSPGSVESAFPTYLEFYLSRWNRPSRDAYVPVNYPLIEVINFPRNASTAYRPQSHTIDKDLYKSHTAKKGKLLPQGSCYVVDLSPDMYHTFGLLPRLSRRITDIYRTRQARIELGLPFIADDLLAEALNLPTATSTFYNQRLETLGDSVLKLMTSVHVMNRFPHRHEGQLTPIRVACISNRTLLARALAIGLERFLSCETHSIQSWRYTVPEGVDAFSVVVDRHTEGFFARKSLQDCMEAILGAAFLTGGIDMALCASSALGLATGGTVPWPLRYSHPESTVTPHLYTELQQKLGYEFHCGDLLIQATTHPSFVTSASSSYQRLEFLGDALIDLVVMDHIYHKFPQAKPGQLSVLRSATVCNQTLAAISVQRFKLQNIMLMNNSELSVAIARHSLVLESMPISDVVRRPWKLDPPKALGDVLEGIAGAILVDSGYNFDKAAAVLEGMMGDALDALSLDLPRDPVTELMIWAATSGCQRVRFKKTQSQSGKQRNDGVVVVVHDVVVAGPVSTANLTIAKVVVAERAQNLLRDASSDMCLSKLCDCKQAMDMDRRASPIDEAPLDLETPSDETEEGFAAIAKERLCEEQTSLSPEYVSPHDELEDD